MDNRSLMQRLIDSGYPEKKCFHHNSDLYVFVTPKTTRVIENWCEEHGFKWYWHCPIFKDQITGKAMYDCAFAYDPYWEGGHEL